jgi:lipopolysaccharide biosynthesis protein
MLSLKRLALIATHFTGLETDKFDYYSIKSMVSTLSDFGCEVRVGVACSELSKANQKFLNELGVAYLVRKNIGYDFGTWADLLDSGGREYDQVVFINSSIVGPFYDVTPIWAWLFQQRFDFIGMTESLEVRRHFQSYMWSASASVVNSDWFRNHLAKPLSRNERLEAIFEKEIPLLELVEEKGYLSAPLFRAGGVCPPTIDPTIFAWQRLLGSGFPFIKKKVMMQENFRELFDLEFPKLVLPSIFLD